MSPNPIKNIENILKLVLVAVAVGLIVRFAVKTANKIAAKKRAKDNQNEEEELAIKLGYSVRPRYSEALHKKVANQIKNAWGFANDNEEMIYNALGQISTGTPGDMIKTRGVYTEITGEDLFSDLQDKLSEKEIGLVRGILSNFPIQFRP